MSELQVGQCHCGDVKLSFAKDTLFKFSCHCDTCQKLVSGGRLLGLGVPEKSVSVEGKLNSYAYAGGSGKPITLSFCPKCSTQMFAKPEAVDDVIVIRSNAMEDPKSFTPEKFLFAEDACDWDCTELN